MAWAKLSKGMKRVVADLVVAMVLFAVVCVLMVNGAIYVVGNDSIGAGNKYLLMAALLLIMFIVVFIECLMVKAIRLLLVQRKEAVKLATTMAKVSMVVVLALSMIVASLVYQGFYKVFGGDEAAASPLAEFSGWSVFYVVVQALSTMVLGGLQLAVLKYLTNLKP